MFDLPPPIFLSMQCSIMCYPHFMIFVVAFQVHFKNYWRHRILQNIVFQRLGYHDQIDLDIFYITTNVTYWMNREFESESLTTLISYHIQHYNESHKYTWEENWLLNQADNNFIWFTVCKEVTQNCVWMICKQL